MHFAFGTADITPPAGAAIPGGFFPRPADGALEPLLATACVVHDGTSTVALVGVDILGVSEHLVADARKQVAARTKIPPTHVLVGASHTHSGGPTKWYYGIDEPEVPYAEQVARGIADAVAQAASRLHGGTALVGAGRAEGIAFNRRFRMRDGRTITHPGKPGTDHHQDIVAPEGPIDESVGVLAFRDPMGRLAGVVVNFGCHTTVVNGNRFSPDYPGYLRKHLRATHGPDLGVVFLLGACGDVTQVDNRATGADFGVEFADRMGRTLAAEVDRAIHRGTWLDALPLAAAVETAKLPFRPDPDVDRERPPYGLGSAPSWEKVFADSRDWLKRERAKHPHRPTEVQALRLGPLAIVTNGAEFFARDGLQLKAASPHAHTWVSTLTNDCVGYVPPADALVAGGYESRTNSASFAGPEGAQLLVEAGLRALGRVL